MKNAAIVGMMLGLCGLTAGVGSAQEVVLDGATLVANRCTSCHTADRVTAQTRTADQWAVIVERMKAHERENPTLTSWTVPGPLSDKTRYYWRARTTGELGTSPWSEGSTFVTDTAGFATTSTVELSEYWLSQTAQRFAVTNAKSKSFGAVVEAPARALDFDALLVIASVENGPAVTPGSRDLGQVFEFGPQGLVFSEPVTLKLPYTQADLTRTRSADANGLTVFAYNPHTLMWEALAGLTRDTASGLLVAQVDHFSLYAIGAATAGASGVAATGKLAPVADAGTDFTGALATALKLNGTKSVDPNPTGIKQALVYAWTLVDHPDAATPAISRPTTSTPTFTPTVPGDYTFCLVVSNKNGKSGERYVTVHVPASVRVTSPAAGASYVLGTSTVALTWETAWVPTARTLSLYLATDGGASNTWTLLKSGVSGTTKTYAWKGTRTTKWLTNKAVLRVCLPASTTNQALCGQSPLFTLQ